MKMIERHYATLKKMVVDSIMEDMVPMDCTPAATWFLAESPKEHWRYREDFYCVLPPAPVAWLEFDVPPVIQSSERRVENHGARSIAALMMTLEIPEQDRVEFLLRDGLLDAFNYFLRKSNIRDGIEVLTANRQQTIREALAAELQPRWIMIWQLVAEPLTRRQLVPFVSYGFYLDQNGQILTDLGVANVMADRKDIPDEHLQHSFADALPFLFALSLTHCRNVEIVEREALPAAVARKRREKGIPEIKFRHIVIKPVGSKQIVGGTPSSKNGMMPLHFVRAHFRTYTEEKPLFGRHVGRYFFHMHARGKSEHGTITKDYEVRTEGA